MKKVILFAFVLFIAASCQNVQRRDAAVCWSTFQMPQINIINEAPDSEGWAILDRLIPCFEEYIAVLSMEVLEALYWSPACSIPAVQTLNFYIRDVSGIGAKWGAPPTVSIFYSTRHVERIAQDGDERVLFETRGVQLHELVHAFQLEPQGIGTYGNSVDNEFFIVIEGIADAIRIYLGGFPPDNRRPGGSWRHGFQRTGYFLVWLTERDPDFIRKLNRSMLEIIPWGFNKAIQHILGEQYDIDELWEEYQRAITP